VAVAVTNGPVRPVGWRKCACGVSDDASLVYPALILGVGVDLDRAARTGYAGNAGFGDGEEYRGGQQLVAAVGEHDARASIAVDRVAANGVEIVCLYLNAAAIDLPVVSP